MAGLFRGVIREIDGAMENTSEGYLEANRNFAQAARNIEAIQAGSDAAMRGRTEDTVSAFQRLTPQGGSGAFRAWTRSLSKRKALSLRADARRPIKFSFTMFCQAASGGPDRRLGNAGSGTSYP